MLLRRSLGVGLGLISAAAVIADQPPDYIDLAYGTEHIQQRLDLYLPVGFDHELHPVLVWIHGGGWETGDKSELPWSRVGPMVGRGFAVASINYRLTGEGVWPDPLHDCKGAMRWLRANAANYDLDPDRIASWGGSAGGHLSAMLGVTGDVPGLEGQVGGNEEYSSAVNAAVVYCPAVDFFTLGAAFEPCLSPASQMLGVCLGQVIDHQDDPEWADEVELVTQAGALVHASEVDPPFDISHGLLDQIHPWQQSQMLYDELLTRRVPASLRLVEDQGHCPVGDNEFYVQAFVMRTLLPERNGDADGDGDVDFIDLSAVLIAFGLCDGDAGWYATIDFDGSGCVDLADISELLSNYGKDHEP